MARAMFCSLYLHKNKSNWTVDWVEGNSKLIWHRNASKSKIGRAVYIETKMTIDKISEKLDEDPFVLDSFW